MPNPSIFESVRAAWSREPAQRKKALDLSCADGGTSMMLASLGFEVVATNYGELPALPNGIKLVGGVDLNEFLPFQSGKFDAVNLVEVIEHIEHQAQLIREIRRVLKPRGEVLISTPNVLNVFSRVRFLFTGFLRGRVRPAHYTSTPDQAPNIYYPMHGKTYFRLLVTYVPWLYRGYIAKWKNDIARRDAS